MPQHRLTHSFLCRNGLPMKRHLYSLLAVAASLTVPATLVAQDQIPVPAAEASTDFPPPVPNVPGEAPIGEPIYMPAEPTMAVPSVAGPACPPAMPAPLPFQPVPMYLSQYAPQQPLCHGMVPLSPSAPMCCMTPIAPSAPFCPTPVAPAQPWCPPGHGYVPADIAYVSGVVGYPFYKAPLYTNSPSTRFQVHPVRKDALLHVSPGNMFPMTPIAPVAKGNYYFRPYNYRQVPFDQIYAATASGNPEAPYSAPLLTNLAHRLDTYKQSLDRALLPALAPIKPTTVPPIAPAR